MTAPYLARMEEVDAGHVTDVIVGHGISPECEQGRSREDGSDQKLRNVTE